MKKELCVKVVICKDYTEMHGQQNITKMKGTIYGNGLPWGTQVKRG